MPRERPPDRKLRVKRWVYHLPGGARSWSFLRVLKSLIGLRFDPFDRHIAQRPVIHEALGKPLGRVLDVGCGELMHANYLLRHALRVTSVDVRDDIVVPRRLKRCGGRFSFVQASGTQLPFRSCSFDTILCCEVLEHIEDDRLCMAELARLAAKDAKAVISVPLAATPRRIEEPDPGGHVRTGYCPDHLKGALEGLGFEVEAENYCLLRFSRTAASIVDRFKRRWGWLPPFLPLFLWLLAACDLVFLSRAEQHGPGGFVLVLRKQGSKR